MSETASTGLPEPAITEQDRQPLRDFTLRSAFALAFSDVSPIVGIYSVLAISLIAAGPIFFWAFPIVLAGKLLVTGVLTPQSIAFAVARVAQEQGAEVVLTGFGRAMSLTERSARRLYSGDLDSTAGKLIGDSASGAGTGDRNLAASGSETLCFHVGLPLATGNTAQGASTTATFTSTSGRTSARRSTGSPSRCPRRTEAERRRSTGRHDSTATPNPSTSA